MSFWTYILRLSNGIYYTGHTDDLEQRLAQHQRGEIKGFTSRHRPVELMWAEEFSTRDEAFEAEWRIGGWSRKKKEALFAGDWARVSHFAKPPSRRVPRPGVSTGSTPARDEREKRIGSAHLEPASSKAETRRRETSPPAIVLVRPQLGENIGKAARAMLNFGLADLRLVAPRDGWPNPSAGPAASGADLVLEQAKVFETVAEAVADCPFVYATTVRKRGLVVPVVSPEEAAREIWGNAGRSAVLFGAERSGLETDEVALAGKIITVAVNPEFRSLNLAQAVILVAYEWSKGAELAVPTLGEEAEPRAPHEHLEGLVQQLFAGLKAADYFHPPDRTPATKNTIRTILTKAGWSTREIQALRGIIRALSEGRRQT
ncbi:MAG TPA: TrmH family RNA methyltransferase [Allosphingosinicella sp.]|nr:TrmH family RNA methyltransferase [Allosphingosinicella sp.]